MKLRMARCSFDKHPPYSNGTTNKAWNCIISFLRLSRVFDNPIYKIAALTLRCGSVYYLQHRSLSSADPHYFVVLNIDPHADDFLILLVASSNITGVKRRNKNLPTETIVEIFPAEYPQFSVPSIIDCNHLFRVTKQELLQKLQSGFAAEKTPIPQSILVKLRTGVLMSPLIEDVVKDMVQWNMKLSGV